MSLADWANVAVIAGVPVVGYQLFQTRRQREQESRPYVVVDLDPYGSRLDLVVRNSGRTSATDVHITIEPELYGGREACLREALTDLRETGVPELPPGRELRYFVAIVTPDFLEQPPGDEVYGRRKHLRRRTWPRSPGRYRDITVIDLAHRRHAYLHAPPVEVVVQRLRDLTEALNGVERAVRELHPGEPDSSG